MTKSEAMRAAWARRRADGTVSTVGLAELRRTAEPGACICCGDPAPMRSQKPDAVRWRKKHGSSDHNELCGDEECRVAYFRYWRKDNRRMLRERRERMEAREATP